MASEKETLADIVAEMRTRANEIEGAAGRDANQFQRELICDLRAEADRIEAAWKREKTEVEADALSVGGIVEASRKREREPVTDSHAFGNAAAMREALNRARRTLSRWKIDAPVSAWNEFDLAMDKIDSALSAPARNCDLYASATEALKAQDVAFNEDNFKNGECKLGCPGCDDGLINCKILWLFATAKERKGEGDEQK